MKKFKKIITLGLAAMVAISAMSMSAFAESMPIDENTGVEFPNKTVSEIKVTDDSKARTTNDLYGEVWIYWNDWDYDENLPSAYAYSVATQSIPKIGAYLSCNSNGTYVTNTGWKYMYNTSAANSGTLYARNVQCVFDATGRFQLYENTEMVEGTHQERFPK